MEKSSKDIFIIISDLLMFCMSLFAALFFLDYFFIDIDYVKEFSNIAPFIIIIKILYLYLSKKFLFKNTKILSTILSIIISNGIVYGYMYYIKLGYMNQLIIINLILDISFFALMPKNKKEENKDINLYENKKSISAQVINNIQNNNDINKQVLQEKISIDHGEIKENHAEIKENHAEIKEDHAEIKEDKSIEKLEKNLERVRNTSDEINQLFLKLNQDDYKEKNENPDENNPDEHIIYDNTEEKHNEHIIYDNSEEKSNEHIVYDISEEKHNEHIVYNNSEIKHISNKENLPKNIYEENETTLTSENTNDIKNEYIENNINKEKTLFIFKDINNEKEYLPNNDSECVVFNITNKLIINIRDVCINNDIQEVYVYYENMSRQEFIQILDTIRELPYSLNVLYRGKRSKKIKDISLNEIYQLFPLELYGHETYIQNKKVSLVYLEELSIELVKNIYLDNPTSITIIENDQQVLDNIKASLKEIDFNIQYYIVPTEDIEMLSKTIGTTSDIVYYSIPYKDIRLCEENIKMVIKNNIFFTSELIKNLKNSNIEKFAFISSSKAYKPVSVSGAIYRNIELLIQSFNTYTSMKCYVLRIPKPLNNESLKKEIIDNKNIDINSEKSYGYFCSYKEVAELIGRAITLAIEARIYIINMGNQICYPLLIEPSNNDLSKLNNENYFVELYTEDSIKIKDFSTTKNQYILLESSSDVDYMIITRLLEIFKDKVEKGTEEECKNYLKQLAIEYVPEN